MRLCLSYVAALLLISSSVTYAQRKCATKSPDKIELMESAKLLKRWNTDGHNKRIARTPVNIKTYWHVVTNGNNGIISKRTIDESIVILNAAYAPSFTFSLQTISVSDNDQWWDIYYDGAGELSMKNSLRQGDCSDLNIYSTEITEGVLGWATMPYWCSSRMVNDGVVIKYSTTPNGASFPYNEGDTLTHEVGHWMGLYHTFQDGCGGNGDLVDDTPAVAMPNTRCVAIDSCPNDGLGNDQVENFMDYSIDACMNKFSAGQFTRMSAEWSRYRSTTWSLAPTLSSLPSTFPTQTVSPTNECISVLIKIRTDKYPTETYWGIWDVTDTSNDAITNGGPYASQLTEFNEELCADPRKCLVFIIFDNYGDGLCCSGGDGAYEVYYDGVLIKTGGAFTSSEISQSFGTGCSLPNSTTIPTFSPTEPPTSSPTSSSTSSPTSKPTLNPTSSPTISPSSKPTPNPTSSPTVSPTSKPTPDPTSLPTASPTMSHNPTPSPIISPTSKPTPNPTSFPTMSPTKSHNPTSFPTMSMSPTKSHNPTSFPTMSPTKSPTPSPSVSPAGKLTPSNSSLAVSSIVNIPSLSLGMHPKVDSVVLIHMPIAVFILMYLY